ncbi:MAG: hypothetical protein V1894_06730 [Chloroflexota bacterium]
MRCVRCGKDSRPGRDFTFYYGKIEGHDFEGDSLLTVYSIAGSEQGFTCQKCIAEYASRGVLHGRLGANFLVGFLSLLLLLMIPFGIVLFFFSPNTSGKEGFWWLLAILFILLFFSFFMKSAYSVYQSDVRKGVERGRYFYVKPPDYPEMTSQVAIGARQHDLTRSGYDAFFSPVEYNRLRPYKGDLFQLPLPARERQTR